jgi:hypothetical protein
MTRNHAGWPTRRQDEQDEKRSLTALPDFTWHPAGDIVKWTRQELENGRWRRGANRVSRIRSV